MSIIARLIAWLDDVMDRALDIDWGDFGEAEGGQTGVTPGVGLEDDE